ncbi:MAG: hypothetical protein RR845_21740, partial [Pseudomonas sp.]
TTITPFPCAASLGSADDREMTKRLNGRTHDLQYIGQIPALRGFGHGLRLSSSRKNRAKKKA